MAESKRKKSEDELAPRATGHTSTIREAVSRFVDGLPSFLLS